MWRRFRAMVAAMGGGAAAAQAYWEKVLNTERASLIGLWRLDETSGAPAVDSSDEANNGAYAGPTLNNAVGADGNPVPLFDGSNDTVNIYSAGLAADFDPNELTIAGWCKVSGASVWGDGLERKIFSIQVDGNNKIFVGKTTGNNNIRAESQRSGALSRKDKTTTDTGWMHFAVTVSASAGANGEFKFFINGVQEGTTGTAIGTWVGALPSGLSKIGGESATARIWSGWAGIVGLWKTALTPAQILEIATINP